MRINYKGCRDGFNYRIAEISFDDSELTLMERITHLLSVRGWKVQIVTDGYALCEVADLCEYREFAKEYANAKRCIRNCMKFGF